jgi:hypothetical protein
VIAHCLRINRYLRTSMRRLGFICLLVIAAIPGLSQDSLKITRDTIFLEPEDTVLIKSYAKRYNPRKALLYAAVVPGLGQVYNKKYWKLPLVYGGFYLIGRNISGYNKVYVEYKNHLFYNIENKLSDTQLNPNINLTTPQLRRIVDKARRERDLWVIVMGGMYLLQIVDAHVDAHLKEFDLNPNLKVRVEPSITNDAWVGRQTGMLLTFRF